MRTEHGDGRPRPRPVLIVGLPRSGTSWLGQTIGASRGARLVGEPDNEDRYAYAIRAKAGLGRFPVLAAGEVAPPGYVRLWEGAFGGGRVSRLPTSLLSEVLHAASKRGAGVDGSAAWSWPRRRALRASVALARPLTAAPADPVIVKTVFASLALDWLCDRWAPRLVLVMKSPLNTVASWKIRGWNPPLDGHPIAGGPEGFRYLLETVAPGRSLPPPPADGVPLKRLTWQLCVLMTVLLDVCSRREDVVLVRHEEASANPLDAFSSLYERLGLRWDSRVEDLIVGSNVAGPGVFDTRRLGTEESERWRERLTDSEARFVRDMVSDFGIAWDGDHG